LAIGPAKPRDADTLTDRKSLHSFADLFHVADDLMTGNKRQFRIGQLAIDDVKVSATNRARGNTNEQLSPPRFRLWHVAQL
jgi:hypothetical protein